MIFNSADSSSAQGSAGLRAMTRTEAAYALTSNCVESKRGGMSGHAPEEVGAEGGRGGDVPWRACWSFPCRIQHHRLSPQPPSLRSSQPTLLRHTHTHTAYIDTGHGTRREVLEDLFRLAASKEQEYLELGHNTTWRARSTGRPCSQGRSTGRPCSQERSTSRAWRRARSTSRPCSQERSTGRAWWRARSTSRRARSRNSLQRKRKRRKSREL
jgi:hypothetical protein